MSSFHKERTIPAAELQEIGNEARAALVASGADSTRLVQVRPDTLLALLFVREWAEVVMDVGAQALSAEDSVRSMLDYGVAMDALNSGLSVFGDDQ